MRNVTPCFSNRVLENLHKEKQKPTKESLLKTLSLLSPWDIGLMWDKGLIQKQIKEIEDKS